MRVPQLCRLSPAVRLRTLPPAISGDLSFTEGQIGKGARGRTAAPLDPAGRSGSVSRVGCGFEKGAESPIHGIGGGEDPGDIFVQDDSQSLTPFGVGKTIGLCLLVIESILRTQLVGRGDGLRRRCFLHNPDALGGPLYVR